MSRLGSNPRFILRSVCILLALVPGPVRPPRTAGGATFDPGCSDPRAIAVADLALRAVGGQGGLERVRFLRFSFVLLSGTKELSRRTYLWDRAGQRLRYETLNDDGGPLIAIISLVDREGEVYRSGQPVDEPRATSFRTQAYDAWRNDAYWLLMPFRLKEAGICLEYGGEESEGDSRYDRVYLTFGNDDLAPDERRYRADFDRETHLLARWSHAPRDERRHGTATVWRWRDWRPEKGLLFSHEKVSIKGPGPLRIIHPMLEIDQMVEEADFLSRVPLPCAGDP